jgi:hypothetical protein
VEANNTLGQCELGVRKKVPGGGHEDRLGAHSVYGEEGGRRVCLLDGVMLSLLRFR